MKIRLLLFIFSIWKIMLFSPEKLQAQVSNNYYLGIMGGATIYYGDLPLTANAGAAVNLTKENVFKTFSLRAQLCYGELKSKMTNDAGQVFVKFGSQFIEASILPEYNLFNIEDKWITPYIATGIAFSGYINRSGYLEGNETYPQKSTFNIPFGGGFKVATKQGIHIRLEYLHRLTFSNLIDGLNNSKGFDYWGQAMIGVGFRLPTGLPYRKRRNARYE